MVHVAHRLRPVSFGRQPHLLQISSLHRLQSLRVLREGAGCFGHFLLGRVDGRSVCMAERGLCCGGHTLVNGSPPRDLKIAIISINTNLIRKPSKPFSSPYIFLSFTNTKFFNTYPS